jgi:hypothetical protein
VPAEEENGSFAQEIEDAKTVADFFGGRVEKATDQRERLRHEDESDSDLQRRPH